MGAIAGWIGAHAILWAVVLWHEYQAQDVGFFPGFTLLALSLAWAVPLLGVPPRSSKKHRVIASVACLAITLVANSNMDTVGEAGVRAKALRELPRMRARVASMEAMIARGELPPIPEQGSRIVIVLGPPLRVTWIVRYVDIDNHVGLAYDPSRRVERGDPVARGWLGVWEVVRAERIEDGWYLVWFT